LQLNEEKEPLVTFDKNFFDFLTGTFWFQRFIGYLAGPLRKDELLLEHRTAIKGCGYQGI
jgi:hypothetical protein